MCSNTIRIGTRASLLARTQATFVKDQLVSAGYDAQLVFISTPGDRSMAPIESIGVGVFTSSLRHELLAEKIDVAVHSYKDLPTAKIDNITIAAVPQREDPRDVLITRSHQRLYELSDGAKVGTSALRRISQLTALRPSLEIRPLRGNLDSRLRKVFDGELDAVVVARAGLIRLGLEQHVTEIFDPQQIMPAPAQGALAIECREQDQDLVNLLERLDDRPTRIAVTAERAVLGRLEAGCTAPVGALARIVDSVDDQGQLGKRLDVRAVVCSPDGAIIHAATTSGPLDQASILGQELADQLLEQGGTDFFEALR